MEKKLVVIDAGHGGKDSGAVGNGVLEKDKTLYFAQELQYRLMKYYMGINVLLTRTGDAYVPLQSRVDMSNLNKTDLFVSIHFNGFFDEDAHGMESYVYSGAQPQTAEMRGVIHTELLNKISPFGITNRGIRTANFMVLREVKAPAILVEPCFITNTREANLLSVDSAFPVAIIQGLANGIVKALDIDQVRYRVITDEALSKERANKVLSYLAEKFIPAHKEVL